MPSAPHKKKVQPPVAKVSPLGPPRQRQPSDLQSIPGIGPSLAQDLHDLGIHRVAQLKRRDPERLYRRLIVLRGRHQDRCVLYAFRCAVYYGSTPRPRADRLRWWRWKDTA
jgi:predicted flap endonuclease-1-like 5' DNA nuclease